MAQRNNKKKKTEEKEEYAEEKKQREWKDLNEMSKYICEKGIITCKYCSEPDAKIKVTSNDISLQESPWVTAGDNNGKVNFQFKGLCKKAPGSNKPPCLQVINLQGWQKTSKTYINNDLALRMDSFNTCVMSGDKLTFKDSGQRSGLGDPQDVMTDGGQYFVDAKWTRDPQAKYQITNYLNKCIVYFEIEMQNTEYISDKVIEIKLFDANDHDKELSITSKNEQGNKYYDIVDSKVIAGFNLLLPDDENIHQLFAICRVRDQNGQLETVRLPRLEENYLTVHKTICIDRYKLIGLNPLGTDIADDMTFGYTKKTPLDKIYDKIKNSESIYAPGVVKQYIEEVTEGGFQESKHKYFANEVEAISEKESPQEASLNSKEDYSLRSDKTIVANNHIPEIDLQAAFTVSTKMRYTEDDIKGAMYNTHKTGEWVWNYKKMVETIVKTSLIGDGRPQTYMFEQFRKIANTYFDWGELSGNIGKMIDKFEANQGGIFETEELSNSLAKNPATDRYCVKINEYIEHKMYQHKGDITDLIDNKIYFDDVKIKGPDSKLRNEKHKKFEFIAFTWSFNDEGLANVLGGRTIALNDIWAKEIYLQSISWTDEFHYKVQYKIILWDHFGLDLPDLQKLFNILPVAQEIFACWFLLKHYYGYRPFITKASFVKEFQGDIRTSSKNNNIIQDQIETERKRRYEEQKAMENILQSKNIWDIKW